MRFESICAAAYPSDSRVVAGSEKRSAFRPAGKADGSDHGFAVRYGHWGYFDAKPFIAWSSSDASIATVDENGG
jgi:hypothetical protein